jgi:hypothetical protein
MEPKTFKEYWEEGCKEAVGEWSCKFIKTDYQWNDNFTKINIWGICKLDHFSRECNGVCSKYKENKPWYKKLFRV